MNKGQKAFVKRTLRRVMRNEIVPVKRKSKVRPLRDENGNPLQVFFVNNLVACPGTGSFESPFCSLPLAQNNSTPGSLIYIYEGDGTSMNYSGPFAMLEGQTYQGSGIPITIGGITIPVQAAGSPVITSLATGIVVADNTTVRGLIIEGAGGGFGIAGLAVDNVLIEYNTISNPGIHGIDIGNHSGTVTIRYNTANNAPQSGISVDHSTFPGTSYIIENSINDSATDGVLMRTNHPDADALISGNTFTRTVFPGLFVGGVGTEVQQEYVEIVNNTMNTNIFWGVHALDGNQLIAGNVINSCSTLTTSAISCSTTVLPGATHSNHFKQSNQYNCQSLWH